MKTRYLIKLRDRIINNGALLDDEGLKKLNGYSEYVFDYDIETTEVEAAEAFFQLHPELTFDDCEVVRL